MNVPRPSALSPSLIALTPFDEADLEWLEPRLEMSRPRDGLRAFCLDGYIELSTEAGHGEACRALAREAGRFPSLAFMPVSLAMLQTFAAARWCTPDAVLPEAARRLHAEAVGRQMAGGMIGRALVLSASGDFARFIENMTMFPKFSVNFGTITSSRVDANSVVVHHDSFYSWMDTIMQATYEALGRYFGLEVAVRVEIHSPWTMDHHLSW